MLFRKPCSGNICLVNHRTNHRTLSILLLQEQFHATYIECRNSIPDIFHDFTNYSSKYQLLQGLLVQVSKFDNTLSTTVTLKS